jgi:hypothetical protein
MVMEEMEMVVEDSSGPRVWVRLFYSLTDGKI